MRKLIAISLIILSCNNNQKNLHENNVKTNKIKQAIGNSIIIKETHLEDTTFIDGNYVLFLRPDSIRFENLAIDENSGIYECDSDFGFGINEAIDTVTKNKKFNKIKVNVSTNRYIVIKGCKNFPEIIDRDTVDYGIILSGKNKQIEVYKNILTGHYIELIRYYFKISN